VQGWQTTYLGMRELPAFFTFSPAEAALIDARRGDAHKLGLALHIGFVRMSGRPLNSVRSVPAVFRFPLERYAGQILPSQTAAKTSAGG